MRYFRVPVIQFCCAVGFTLLVTVPSWCISRGGSDYGGGGPPGVAPASCTGPDITTFGDVTAVCGFSGSFGSGDQFAHDTILHFELTDSSSSDFVNSATLQFTPTAAPTEFGFVDCGDPSDPGSLLNNNPKVPCTAQATLQGVTFNIPTDSSGNPALNSNGTLSVSFSGFSGAFSGTGLSDGVTIFFTDPNATGSFVAVTGVSTTAATPEPASIGLLVAGLAGVFVFLPLRKRCIRG
jgi:hypothetical protein